MDFKVSFDMFIDTNDEYDEQALEELAEELKEVLEGSAVSIRNVKITTEHK